MFMARPTTASKSDPPPLLLRRLGEEPLQIFQDPTGKQIIEKGLESLSLIKD